MNINIICVGKIKENYLLEGIKEYSKRISKYANLKIVELQDKSIPINSSQKDLDKIKELEGEEILKYINLKDYTIALDVKADIVSSEFLAKKISNISINGFNTINFIIGGSLGISNLVLSKSNFTISFSKMTFPHQLFRLILLEQIYRSFKINNNETYHK